MMRLKGILFLCSLAVVPQLAMADQPSPQMLGIAQAVADFCSKVDPRDAAAFQAIWKNIASMPATQLASAKADSTFKQGYQEANAWMAKFPGEEQEAGCKTIVGKGAPERGPTHEHK